MSDEPQPQQQNEGGAPEEPLPAEGPGEQGGRTGKEKRHTPDRENPSPGSNTRPGGTSEQGRPNTRENTTADRTLPGAGADGSASAGTGAVQAARARRAALAAQASRAGRTGTEGRAVEGSPAPETSEKPQRLAGPTPQASGRPQRPEAPASQGSGKSQGSVGPQRPAGPTPQASGRPQRPEAPASQGSGKSQGSVGPQRSGESQGTAKARESEQPPSAESTQVLRRIKPPSAPQAAKDGSPPDTTQVLRRVNAPRQAESNQPTQPGKASGAAKGAQAGTASGAAKAAQAAAAGAAAPAGPTTQGTASVNRTPQGTSVNRTPQGTSANRTTQGTPANRTPATGPADETTALAASGGDGGGDSGGDGGGKGKKPKRPKRTGWRRLIPTWRMVLGTFVIGVLLVIGLFFLGYSLVKIPPANALATKQSNVYLYADGSQLARDGKINRESVSLAQISKDAQHAVLAAEDRDFYTESAVDPKAMLRAAWNTATGKGKQSGSTITQQYVKNYYLAQEQTVTRKAKEFFISIKLDQNKSKDQILEGYLNTSYFGRNAYGIQAAAQAYYGRDATDLDPARAAYLAALVNAPSEYDVVAHPENKSAALARWNYVLDGMVTKGWLSEAERTGMKFPMPKEQTISTGLSGQRGYLVEAVKHYLTTNNIIDPDKLAVGGYRITTTIQKDKQDAFVKAVNDQLMSKLDKKNNKVDKSVRAGGASVDPKTGKVVAMYGGVDYVKQYTNGATRGDFQVGSTFKPFVFTSAVEDGSTTQDGQAITPNTYYDGTNKRPVQGWNGGAYAPENEDSKSYGDITVRKATDLSVNTVYAQMAVDVGPSKVKQTAVDLGIPADTKDLQPYPSIALGTATASVLDMAEAYATLANHGKHGTYTMIEKVTKDGVEEVKLPDQPVKQAVSREAADTTTSVLQSVVDNGTATAAQAAGRPAAGKTGTAEEDTAAWFAGYTPDLATVVSVMGQDPVTAAHKPLYGAMGLPRINGGGAPTDIWAQFTKDALKGKPVSDFDLELQQGADVQAPASQAPTQPGTTGSDNGGPTGTPTGSGKPTHGTTGGDNTTGTPTDGGPTGGDTTTDGGATTTGGDTTTGGGTPGGTTGGDTTTGGGTPGGADGGDAATGGGTDVGTTDGGVTAGQ